MTVFKRISIVNILVFAACVTVDVALGFCRNGRIITLECSGDSLLTGIQTTNQLFSADSTPICSTIVGETDNSLPPSYLYRSISDDSDPKAECSYPEYAMKSVKLCFGDGGVTEFEARCAPLKYVVPPDASYTVVGEASSPVLKCEEGSVLHGFKFSRGNSRPVAHCSALDVGNDNRLTYEEKKFCRDEDLVKVACPDGYLVTGVQSPSGILSPDVTPVCSKIADKIVPEMKQSSTYFYYGSYPLIQADCGGSDPILLSYGLCFVDGVITRSTAHCRRFQDDVEVTAHYNLEVRPSSTMLKCPEGSFFRGLRLERNRGRDYSNATIRARCTAIGE